jgi:phosphatidylglycerol:prolipoprotein diacylglycerol transferase
VGGFTVYWYGIIIAVGFLLAIVYALKTAPRYNLDKDRMLDVVLFTTPLAILSARAYFCIFPYEDGERITSFKEFFGLGSGEGFRGLAIYGGVIGAFLFGFLLCKIRKVNVLDMFDIASVGFLIGQGIGRWGNFFNQEAFGTATGSEWFGMMSANTGYVNVHPCFLYESIWCVAGFFVLNYFSKKRIFSGQIFLMYGMWYGFGRFFIEWLRTDSLMIGKMRVSMLVSALAFVVSAVLLFVLYKLK